MKTTTKILNINHESNQQLLNTLFDKNAPQMDREEAQVDLLSNGIIDNKTIGYFDVNEKSYVIHNIVTNTTKSVPASNFNISVSQMTLFKVKGKPMNYVPQLVTNEFMPVDERVRIGEDGDPIVNLYKRPYTLKEESLYFDEIIKKYPAIDLVTNNTFGEYRGWFFNWLAYGMRYSIKSAVTPVSITNQGVGKGIIASVIIREIYKDYFRTIENKDLMSNFNSYINRTQFIFGDEIHSPSNKGEARDVSAKLKRMVSDDTETLDIKGISAKNINTFYNMWIASNKDNPVELEDSDRRYSIMKVVDTHDLKKHKDVIEMGGTHVLLQRIREEVASFVADLGRMHVDVNKARTAIENEAKEEIKKESEGEIEAFARDLRDTNPHDFVEEIKEFIDPHEANRVDGNAVTFFNRLQIELSKGAISLKSLQVIHSSYYPASRASAKSIAKKYAKVGRKVKAKVYGDTRATIFVFDEERYNAK